MKKNLFSLDRAHKEYADRLIIEIGSENLFGEIKVIKQVYSNFLFKNNKSEIEEILKICNLENVLIKANSGISIFVIETNTSVKYLYFRIIDEDIINKNTFLTSYFESLENYFNNNFILLNKS